MLLRDSNIRRSFVDFFSQTIKALLKLLTFNSVWVPIVFLQVLIFINHG